MPARAMENWGCIQFNHEIILASLDNAAEDNNDEQNGWCWSVV